MAHASMLIKQRTPAGSRSAVTAMKAAALCFTALLVAAPLAFGQNVVAFCFNQNAIHAEVSCHCDLAKEGHPASGQASLLEDQNLMPVKQP